MEETTGTAKTTYVYDGLQMVESTTGVGTPSAKTFEYYYDPFGNLDCVTDTDESSCPRSGDIDLVKDYTWDGLNRLWDVESWSNGTQTDDTTYTYDALDRVVQQTEAHAMDASAKNRTTDFSFLGLSNVVTRETFQGNNKASEKKTYSYDGYNQRVSMVDYPSGLATSKTYTYGYDVHGSVSTLLDDSNGQVKASYGYDAYGGKDPKLSAGDDADTHDPLNAYRYSGRRFDTGSQTLDMGARRFGPDSQTFLQPDQYAGALANLGLSMDPLTGNRYSLAAGNPVGFVEVDGHRLAKAAGGAARIRTPGGPASGDPQLPDVGNAAPAESVDSVMASVGTALRDIGSGAREGVEDFVGFGKGVVMGTVEAGGQAVNAAFSCVTDFSGCRQNVGGFASAVWNDPFGVASTVVNETIDDVMTKIRQGHPGEAVAMVVGGGKFKGVSKLDEAVGAVRKVGTVLESVDDVLANPRLLAGRTPAEIQMALGSTPGWEIETLGRGSRAGEGLILRQYTSAGDRTGRLIQWHPGGGHHGPNPYWKVSSPEGGTQWIFDEP